jgi:hypothetical protein
MARRSSEVPALRNETGGQIRGQHEGIQPTKCWDMYSISKQRTQMMMDLLNNNCIRPTAFKTTPTKDGELTPKQLNKNHIQQTGLACEQPKLGYRLQI